MPLPSSFCCAGQADDAFPQRLADRGGRINDAFFGLPQKEPGIHIFFGLNEAEKTLRKRVAGIRGEYPTSVA